MLPSGSTDEKSNFIETFVDTLLKDGKVQVGTEEKPFAEIIQLPDEENDEEEEKKELPEQLAELTPQEFFIVNSARNFKLGVLGVQANRLELLANRLFTSFALSCQALGVSADAFTDLSLSQGLRSKQALAVKNSLLALADKSAALGKKTDPEHVQLITKFFTLLLNYVQLMQQLSNEVKTEINSDIALLFSDKKADAMQDYYDRVDTTLDHLVSNFSKTLMALIQAKIAILTMNKVSHNFESVSSKLPEIAENLDGFSEFVQLQGLLEEITTIEELSAYT